MERPVVEWDGFEVLLGQLERVEQAAGAPGAHVVGRDLLKNLVEHGEYAGRVAERGEVDRFFVGATTAAGHDDAGAGVEIAEGRSAQSG